MDSIRSRFAGVFSSHSVSSQYGCQPWPERTMPVGINSKAMIAS
jgi:hypothetical protein